ncbi:hypothetical protein JHK86_022669 [Glycine max]|nr:hypothetical protein JHK86_022669 [Glycine max]
MELEQLEDKLLSVYAASQKGLIGIILNSDWYAPVSKEKSDQDAARRGLDFMFGWYDNITKTDKRYGSYISRVPDSLLKKSIPDFARPNHDGLYRAIDIYLKTFCEEASERELVLDTWLTQRLANHHNTSQPTIREGEHGNGDSLKGHVLIYQKIK